jgi:hypothetical protein
MKHIAAVLVFGIVSGLLFSQAPGDVPVTIDNSYTDWQRLPASATFSSNYNPAFFSREKGGQRQKLSIEESIYWKRGGTLVRELKSYLDEASLYLYVEVNSPFAEETSLYCYPYSQRARGEVNFFAIELVPEVRQRAGGVLLWEDGRSTPRIIGTLRSSSISLECVIPLRELPESFTAGDITTLSFDLTSSYYEAVSGMYEEFFFTTLYFKDIVKKGESGGGM